MAEQNCMWPSAGYMSGLTWQTKRLNGQTKRPNLCVSKLSKLYGRTVRPSGRQEAAVGEKVQHFRLCVLVCTHVNEAPACNNLRRCIRTHRGRSPWTVSCPRSTGSRYMAAEAVSARLFRRPQAGYSGVQAKLLVFQDVSVQPFASPELVRLVRYFDMLEKYSRKFSREVELLFCYFHSQRPVHTHSTLCTHPAV